MEWHLLSASGLLVSVIVLFVLIVSLIQLLCFKRSQPVPRHVTLRNKRRVTEEDHERRRAMELIQELVKKEAKYEFVRELHNIGRRLQKYWTEVRSVQDQPESLILTTAPLSKNCRLRLDDKDTLSTFNSLLKELNKHPLIHKIREISYIAEGNLVVIVQKAVPHGSLKDIIWKGGIENASHEDSSRQIACCSASRSRDAIPPGFDVSWSEKDYTGGTPLSLDKVKLYGKQIIKILRFFKEHKFPTMEHVHTGNLFVVDGVCMVGGHENSLLGYKSRLHKTCAQNGCADSFEVIMFGHIIFEMVAGQEPSEYVPTEEDYDLVKESEFKEMLEYIFKRDKGKFIHDLKQIRKQHFKYPGWKVKDHFKISEIKLSKEMKDLLKTSVRE